MIGVGMLIMIGVTMGESPPLLKGPEAKAARVVKEFPRYELMGRLWRNIVIAPNPSLDALSRLAQQLHAEDPLIPFHIFTDGNTQQFRRFMLANIHYNDPVRYPHPKAWADRHYIAMINQFGGTDVGSCNYSKAVR